MKHEDPNTEYKPASFVCSHVADRSLLAQGFTLPGAMLVDAPRCQICGEQVASAYDSHVDEVHHIYPFVTSLNNDVSNLVVLCPNHHRIVHATHAQFRRAAKSFAYPNGPVEPLKVNVHL